MSVHHTVAKRQQALFRREVLRRDGYQCVRCGKRARLEADHVVPLAEGGAHHPDNGQTLCRACHIEKDAHARAEHVEGQAEWEAMVKRA